MAVGELAGGGELLTGDNSSGVGDGFAGGIAFAEVGGLLFLLGDVRLDAGELRGVMVTLPDRFSVFTARDFAVGTKCTATGFG